MRQFIVVLVDSLRESRDRRSLTVLLALSLVPILFCFGVSFEQEPMTEILRKQAAELTTFRQAGGHRTLRQRDKRPEVGEVAPVGEGWAPTVAGGHAIELTWESESTLDGLAVAWFRFQDHGYRRDDDAEVAAVIDGQPRAVRFLEQRFALFGYENVEVRIDPGSDGNTGARVAVRADEPATVEGAHTINLMFGFWSIESPEVSIAAFVIFLQSGLAGVFVGGLGMLVALMACSAFVPNMLQKGTLDLVLARPISRTRLLLAKYCGGLWFVFVLATFMVVGCWIGLAVGSGYTNPWFLVSILTVTASFAVIYSVSVLIGVLTRSAGISALCAIGLWWVSGILVSVRAQLRMMPFGADGGDVPDWLDTGLDVAYFVLPKVKDLGYLNTLALSHRDLSAESRRQIFGADLPPVDWVLSLGTTAAFTALMLGLAIWVFRRRDY